MYRLENQILDLYDDANFKQTLPELLPRIPEFLKTAAAPSPEINKQRPDNVFALCLLTKCANKLLRYPIDTPADTFFSSEYLQRSFHKLPAGAVKMAATNINAACQRFGINPTAIVKEASKGSIPGGNVYVEPLYEPNGFVYDEALLKRAAAEVPMHSPAFQNSPHMYAIVKKASANSSAGFGDAGTVCKYAMPTPEHVRMAVDYFTKYASEFSPADRHQFAYNVRMRAQELGVAASSPVLDKYAGVDGYGPYVDAQISLRKSCCINGDRIAAYDRLLEKQASVQPQLFAQALEELDKRAGLTKYYGGPINDAYASTFGSAREAAMRKTASAMIDMGDTRKRELVVEHFGKDVADLLAKEGAAAMEALPNDAKEVLAAIESGGIA
jgi:hypothetical protein